ncbi:MAG: NADH-quinone oxidoreductase subunit N [Thermodesulfovibrio sp.]|nr:NADH-quinone oxidoreductase subunit N [Thermodesulfovibrio sp.]
MSQYYLLLPEIVFLTLGILSFCYGFIKRVSLHTWALGFISITVSLIVALFSFTYEEFSTGLIKINIYNQILRVLIYLAGLFILAFSYEEFKKGFKNLEEYIFLLTVAIFGMNIMIFANDLLLLYLALETFSLSLYILAAFYRDDKLSIEAGLKYFILGTVSSIILLGSIVFFYAITGSTSYDSFKLIKTEESTPLLALVFLISAFAFKLSLAPFHAWAPDVYQGAPTPVTAFFSTAPKVAVFSVAMNTLLSFSNEETFKGFIVILSVLSLLVGNILALRQNNLKRMLAYSSIAHAGYMFMALLLPENRIISTLLPYLIVYVFMNIGAFAFILSIREGEKIVSYHGVGKINPLLGLSILVIMFSLTGIPPTAGFIVKFNLFKDVFAVGYSGLVFFALLMSIFSAFYYLRVVFYVYKDVSALNGLSKSYLNQTISLLSAILILILGIFPNVIVNF